MLIEVGAERPGLVATVAPARGGRTVALRWVGGANLIDPGPTDWASAGQGEDRPDACWRQDFGQVVWLGPQSRFWSDQTALPGRPTEAAGWPPDPVSVHGVYSVLAAGAERVVLRGPASLIWQVELTKTWEALADGAVRFSVEARNVSNKSIRKGLWFNFRAPPDARVRIPVLGTEDCRIAGEADMAAANVQGWLELAPPLLPVGVDAAAAKVFVRPSRGVIRFSGAGGWLELVFVPTDPGAVAEGHAPVEVYRKTLRGSWSILELDQHAPWVELRPGEVMRQEEVWRWVKEDVVSKPGAFDADA